MRLYAVLFSLLYLGFGIPSYGQDRKQVDSLWSAYTSADISDSLKVNALAALINKYMYNDTEKAKAYILELKNFSTRTNNKRGIAGSYLCQGILLDYQGQLDSAKVYYQIANTLFTQNKDTIRQIRTSMNLSIIDYKEGAYQEAITRLDSTIAFCQQALGEDNEELGALYDLLSLINTAQGHQQIALKNGLYALRLHQQHGNKVREADALQKLGNFEKSLGNFEKSITYHQEALIIYEAREDVYYQASSYNDLGAAYLEIKDYEKAEKYLLKSIELANQMEAKSLESTIYLNMNTLFQEKKLFERALDFAEKSFDLIKESNYPKKIAEALVEIGKNHLLMNQPEKALLYFNRSVTLADSIKANTFLKDAYLNRSIAYENLGKNQLALKDFKQYQIIHDTLLNQTKIQQIEELRILHDLEKKEQSIELQQNQITLLEKEAALSSLQKWLLGLGLGLSCIIFGLTYYGFQQKMKRNRLQKEQQKVLYEKELEFKKRELTAHALHLAKKNEVLGHLKQKAIVLKEIDGIHTGYQKLINTIDFDLKDEDNWENFKNYFEQIHTDFNTIILEKYPNVTPNELRLMALLKMNLSSKEIANILNISAEGVKKARQRLRKKLDLTPADSLEKLIMEI